MKIKRPSETDRMVLHQEMLTNSSTIFAAAGRLGPGLLGYNLGVECFAPTADTPMFQEPIHVNDGEQWTDDRIRHLGRKPRSMHRRLFRRRLHPRLDKALACALRRTASPYHLLRVAIVGLPERPKVHEGSYTVFLQTAADPRPRG
jgi:hypothetical protein